MTRTTARLARLAGGLLAGSLVLAGCSGEDGSAADGGNGSAATTQAEEFNDADVAFAQGMIPHHEGALMMSEVAVERAQDPRVRELAERIQAAQDPEIELMTGWLEDWGQPVEQDSMGGMEMEDMPAAGADFDRIWLQSMIEHHDGAVVMAQIEIDEGANDEAIDLAEQIAESQTQEIDEMQQLLSELGG